MFNPDYRFESVECLTFLHMDEVSYPPVGVVALGFRREDVEHPLDGFGVLVPGAEDAFQISS